MHVKMKKGHEHEFPSVKPKAVDPAFWVDSASMGQEMSELRKEDIKKGLKTEEEMKR